VGLGLNPRSLSLFTSVLEDTGGARALWPTPYKPHKADSVVTWRWVLVADTFIKEVCERVLLAAVFVH
jgi:hypothetical protein